MSKPKHICPSCGNRDPKLIEDNGLRSESLDFALLCVKMIPVEDSFYADQLARLGHVKDGCVPCGTQWEPNAPLAGTAHPQGLEMVTRVSGTIDAPSAARRGSR